MSLREREAGILFAHLLMVLLYAPDFNTRIKTAGLPGMATPIYEVIARGSLIHAIRVLTGRSYESDPFNRSDRDAPDIS